MTHFVECRSRRINQSVTSRKIAVYGPVTKSTTKYYDPCVAMVSHKNYNVVLRGPQRRGFGCFEGSGGEIASIAFCSVLCVPQQRPILAFIIDTV
jgi:hypothetical protein